MKSLDEMAFVQTQEHILPNEILVSIDISKLRNGSELKYEEWEPLLGGELMPLWDTMLANPGDEIVIRGSSAVKLIFGGYVYDAETGHASKALRADIDVISSEAIRQRVHAQQGLGIIQYEPHQNITINDLKIDLSTWESIQQDNLTAIEDLERAIVVFPDPERAELEVLLRVAKAKTTKNNPAELMRLNAFYKQQAMGIKLTKKGDGQISATVVDPDNLLSRSYLQETLNIQQRDKIYVGYALNEYEHGGVKAIGMRVMTETQDAGFETGFPLWVVQNLHRLVKDAVELNNHGLTSVGFRRVQASLVLSLPSLDT